MLYRLNCVFHHLGLACADLDREAGAWLGLGYRIEAPTFEDPTQKVRGRFLIGPGPRLELLAPRSADSPISAIIRSGAKIYHQAYEAPAFEETIATLRAANFKLVTGPVPAVAFEGRQIAFLVAPNLNVIEIIEAPPDGRADHCGAS